MEIWVIPRVDIPRIVVPRVSHIHIYHHWFATVKTLQAFAIGVVFIVGVYARATLEVNHVIAYGVARDDKRCVTSVTYWCDVAIGHIMVGGSYRGDCNPVL